MRITIPDEVAALYEPYAAAQGRSLDEVLTAQLTRFAKLEPGKRAIILGPKHIEALETMTGRLPLRDAADLQKRVDDLAAVTFSHIRLDFSASQLAEIAHRAERQGRPAAQIVREMIDATQRDMFWNSGGGEATAEPAIAMPAPV